MMSLTFRKRICWHEAGHAVAAYLQNRDLVVRVQRHDRAGFKGGQCTYNLEVDVRNETRISASGVAGERLYGKASSDLMHPDGAVYMSHENDLENVARQLHLSEAEGVPREFLEQLFETQVQLAYEELLPYREAIGRLAEAIFKRQVVYGHELPEILGF